MVAKFEHIPSRKVKHIPSVNIYFPLSSICISKDFTGYAIMRWRKLLTKVSCVFPMTILIYLGEGKLTKTEARMTCTKKAKGSDDTLTRYEE